MDGLAELGADFKSYQERLMAAVTDMTRASIAVGSHDLSFHRSVSDKIDKRLDSQNSHLLRLTNKLLKAAVKDTNITTIPHLQDRDAIDDKWRAIVDVIDDLLEKADASLDEFNGVIKRFSPARPSTPENTPAKSKNVMNNLGHIPKPQLLFERKVDNYAKGPWRPLLASKPHARIPLDESIGGGENRYNHPYAFEIQNITYPSSLYEQRLPIPFTRPENSQAIFIDTEEGVRQMLEELKTAPEIAIDLEHNDKNSYVGMVCLMQISTRSKDWIVDTLKPWRENLQILNEVFADPTIVKIFHGSTSDMIWLQRDLGLYIVCLFDTYHACCALQFPGRGLAFLLEKYANFHAQKQYQLADWRQRPLSPELLDYARSDTHYLLYIYDNLRNELLKRSTDDNSLMTYVLDNSQREALQTYEREEYDRDNGLGTSGWLKMLVSRSHFRLDKQQFGVLRALHEWRDQKARELDEGENNLMPNAYLWACVEHLPSDLKHLFNTRLMGRAPRYISTHTKEIIDVIKRGKIEGINGPEVDEVILRNSAHLAQHRKFLKNNPSPKPQAVQRSLAETMRTLVQSGDLQATQTPSTEQAAAHIVSRSTQSAFWGSVTATAPQIMPQSDAMANSMDAIMPLNKVALNSDIPAAATASLAPITVSQTISTGSEQFFSAPPMMSDSDMTMTHRGEKRKAEAPPSEDVEMDEDEVTNESDQDQASSPLKALVNAREEKMARKEAKRVKRAAQKAELQAAQANITPFDYTNAKSILYASSSNDAKTTNAGVTAPKPMNLAAKALDTSTGAKRNKFSKELAGKSHTFKS